MLALWSVGSAMRILTALVTLALIVGCASRGVPITNSIQNFGKVNDSLYRGSQPDEKAMRQLHALGIKSVINLRMTMDVWKEESEAAASNSMAYTNIPLESLSAPTDAQVASILAAISSMP